MTDFDQSFSVKPHFKDPEIFVVVKSRNTYCVYIVKYLLQIENKFIFGTQASPPPNITWLKNGEPVSPWNKIVHTDGTCTLDIPSSKYSDSGVYTVVAKNSNG